MQTKFLSPKAAWLGWLLLVLSPLALLAGIFLTYQNDPNLRVGMAIDRQQAVTIARRFAAAKGLDATQWNSYCHIEHRNERYFYYRLRPDRELSSARRDAPEVVAQVILYAPDQKENIEVTMTPDGRALGFTRSFRAGQQVADPGEAAARTLAAATLKARPEAAALAATPAILNETRNAGVATRRYSWKWPITSLPEMDRQIVVTVRGSEVIGETIETKFDEAFAKQYLDSNLIGQIAFGMAYGVIVMIVLVFGIYRFVKRAQQKEVSYARVLLLGLLTASIFIMFLLQTDVVSYPGAARLQPGPIWIGLLFSCIAYVFIGMIIGLAYGSGEGDIREAYPGKLTSLDALLVGKVFSRNVGQAFVHGAALGGWALLLVQLAVLPWAHQPEAGWQLSERLEVVFARLPWFTHLYGWLSYAILSIVVGVLLPLPFLHRRLRHQRVVFLWLSLFVWGACLIMSLQLRPWAATLLVAAAYAATLLTAFFKYDLLTANISVGIPALVGALLTLTAQPAPAIHKAGLITTAIIVGLFGINLFCYFKGRLYHEDEVRPQYASNLAERQSMQAEVSAAREAQIRLLPQTLPQLPRLSIAAACTPAREVGGDFYDLYKLDQDKLGIFMAEGGGRGLAAALSIAFAKGFLMPKIHSGNRGDDAPSEIVRSLQTQLTRLRQRNEAEDTEDEAGLGFLYAVIDTADGTLRYARTGNAPQILIYGNGKDEAARQPEEHESRFALDRSGETVISVLSGQCAVDTGDAVMLFTDGLAKTWAGSEQLSKESGKETGKDGFWKMLASHHPNSGNHLSEALDRAMSESDRQARRRGIADDLTAVIVRIERSGSAERAEDV